MQIEGQCHCRLIAYKAEIDPEAVSVCHRRDCQTLTAHRSRRQLSVPVPPSGSRAPKRGSMAGHASGAGCSRDAHVEPSHRFGYARELGQFPDRARPGAGAISCPACMSGAVLNWTVSSGDASATNDKAAIQNALNFAGRTGDHTDNGGHAGATVLVPAGSALACGGLMVPQSVILPELARAGRP